MDVHLRRVDRGVGELAHGLEEQPLQADALANGEVSAHGMGTARFDKSPHQGMVAGLQENQRSLEWECRNPLVHFRKLAQRLPAANVHDDCGALDAASRRCAELRKHGDEIERKIVHAIEPEIFERLEDGAFTRPAQAGDDDELAGNLLGCALHNSSDK